MTCAEPCWPRCRACARSQYRFAATSTGPTIWSRRRCCAPGRISIRSSRAPTCLHGCSRSCETISAANIRKRRREVEDADGGYAERLTTPEEQTSHIEFGELREALLKLSADQREALILVGASGFSYEEAAKICDCAVGTIKSRVNRARIRLAEILGMENRAGNYSGNRNRRGRPAARRVSYASWSPAPMPSR